MFHALMHVVTGWWHLVVSLNNGDNPQLAYGVVIVTALLLVTALALVTLCVYGICEDIRDRRTF